MKKWVHIIGIAGVATGQIAVEFKNNDYLVSGSDKGVFPPMSDHLINNGVNIELGYKKEHLDLEYYQKKYGGEWNMHNKKLPDLIVAQGTKGTKNDEYVYALDNKLEIKSYPEILSEFVVVPNKSIVISGTYGKTTTTAMLAWIFTNAGIEVSYMFGGLSNDLSNGVKFKNSKTQFSIIEGDEYYVSPENPISKFYLYNPTFLLLTSAQWDHADIFKTKEDYINNFIKLVKSIPRTGCLIYSTHDENVIEISKLAQCDKIPFAQGNIKETESLTFIDKDLKVLGEFNKTNALAAVSLSSYLNLDFVSIKNAIKSFTGIKRRLEIKHERNNLIVIDDFGASPSKAKSAIWSVKNKFPDKYIIGIFEPNLGSRTTQGIDEYKGVFDLLDKLYLPRFTYVPGDYIDNNTLAEFINKDCLNAIPIAKDEDLMKNILLEVKNKDSVVMFMGSHGFRGMIDEIVEKSK